MSFLADALIESRRFNRLSHACIHFTYVWYQESNPLSWRCKCHALPTELQKTTCNGKRLEKRTNHGHLALLCQFRQLVRIVFCFDESLLHVIQCLSRERERERERGFVRDHTSSNLALISEQWHWEAVVAVISLTLTTDQYYTVA